MSDWQFDLTKNEAPGRFEFSIPEQVVFGWGRRAELPQLLPPGVTRLLLVAGSRGLRRLGVVDQLVQALAETGRTTITVAELSQEPTVADVDEAVATAMDAGARPGDALLALGGGAAIDLAKAVAGLVTNPPRTTVRDFLEGVGTGRTIERRSLPIIALPTTAGTGAEATRNAVISSADPPFKKSLRSRLLLPALALVDPELTTSCPRNVTVASGMDAITQLIESYVSRRATPVTQALCLRGLTGSLAALRTAAEHGDDRPSRERMALAALLSGMALANSGLGIAHGVAASLGIHARVAHGLACAVMLPVAIETNRAVARDKLAAAASAALQREFASADEAIDALLADLASLYAELGVPTRLSQLGVTAEALPRIARDSYGNSMSGNPREISPNELLSLLEAKL